MKELDASSWVCHVRHLLNKYKLPLVCSILNWLPKKEQWHQVRDTINSVWTDMLRNEAHEKSTLKYLSIDACTANQMCPVLLDLSSSSGHQESLGKDPLAYTAVSFCNLTNCRA